MGLNPKQIGSRLDNIIKSRAATSAERRGEREAARKINQVEKAEAKAAKAEQAAQRERDTLDAYVAERNGFDDAEKMKRTDPDLYESEMAKLKNNAEASKEAKEAGSGLVKPTVGGAAIGAISGAGIGGVTGLATGADEDDMKSMVVMGALAGGTAGAITGGTAKAIKNRKATKSFFKDSNALDVAADAATGKANHAIKDGAKGVFSKAGASVQSFGDKIDDIGGNISKRITTKAEVGAEQTWTADMLDRGYGMADLLDDGTVMGNAMSKSRNAAMTDAVEKVTGKANVLGGAAEGAIIGSTSGAVIGGISGAIDEDDTALSGALRGGLIGGTLGGIGGGASGYFNKSGRVLSNTTNNLKSLVGGN